MIISQNSISCPFRETPPNAWLKKTFRYACFKAHYFGIKTVSAYEITVTINDTERRKLSVTGDVR